MMDVMRCLPKQVSAAVRDSGVGCDTVTDIRLRAGSCASLTCQRGGGRVHIPLPSAVTDEEGLRGVLSRLCAGSVHVYDDGLLRGSFSPQQLPGVRIGVAGRLLCGGGRAERLQLLTSLCIRLPHTFRPDAGTDARLYALIHGRQVDGGETAAPREEPIISTLFYAPPGEGKTTLLRCLIRTLCSVGGAHHPVSAAVLDTGEELCGDGFADCTVDCFRGYPRGLAMEIATRAFSPQVIFSDEIGSEREAEEILRAQACGIPLIATAHADSFASLLRRPCFAKLYENGVFCRYIRLCRGVGGGFVFRCEEGG